MFWENEGKIHKGVCVKFFFVNFQTGILQLHYEFQEFSWNEHIPMATSLWYTKCLKSNCEIVIVYAGWNPATCPWNKQPPRGAL